MSNPDEIEMDEGWISDAESVIHQHCGSDSSDDSHNDWVHDLAVDLWRTLERERLRDAIHAHVAHVFVSGNGESVQALGPPEAVGAIREAIAERDRLRGAQAELHEEVDA